MTEAEYNQQQQELQQMLEQQRKPFIIYTDYIGHCIFNALNQPDEHDIIDIATKPQLNLNLRGEYIDSKKVMFVRDTNGVFYKISIELLEAA